MWVGWWGGGVGGMGGLGVIIVSNLNRVRLSCCWVVTIIFVTQLCWPLYFLQQMWSKSLGCGNSKSFIEDLACSNIINWLILVLSLLWTFVFSYTFPHIPWCDVKDA